jgi:valyl-tRNA synthetase
MELAKSYDPKEAEQNHYKRWEESGFFAPEINKDSAAESYSIVIPPPNVTGSLHMGHALQHTLMDALTRWKRMLGYRTLFLVGVDHAGISTQLMVTRQLKKEEHKTPQDIGREAFTEKVWEWKHKFGNEITRQIRREGLSVDWSRERFTMDESLSKAVREVFVRLYEEGWIYRGTRIVNWCPRDKTVLSDLEVKEEKAKDGKLYYLTYPIKGSDKTVTVATTRPETMLGDTAVAVNPEDDRYKDMIGMTIDLPLTGREILVIADEYVEAEFGTGAVKITPAHDANDWEIGERHGLEKIVVMNDDATMNAAAGEEFVGLDRYDARAKVIEKFEEAGLLEKIEDYDTTLPHCERCKTVIEPLLSEQWFVKMDEMRDLALKLMNDEGLPRFFPEVPNRKVYTTWLENLRDWTISRQLWWGHQIPAWYDGSGNVYVARTADEAYEKAGTRDLTQDADVLDTWFSSALWPFSTLGWTGSESAASADLKTFYPTDVLITGRDIIFLWVSRMVMSGMKFIGERPFDDVVITGTVLDKNGQRMSKTKGNGIDPLDVFDKYGVDATRMTLAGSATGMDFAWRDEKVESYRNFANKIWNATRFCLMNSEKSDFDWSTADEESRQQYFKERGPHTLADRWIGSRINKTAFAVNRALEKYQFHEAVGDLYHFFWDDFCDWYIEFKKDDIVAGNILASAHISWLLDMALRMLHPFMPYLTEDLWLKLSGSTNALHHPAYKDAEASIMLTAFPLGNTKNFDDIAEGEMGAVIDLIKAVRNIRAEMNISTAIKFTVHVASHPHFQTVFESNKPQILKLAKAEDLVISDTLDVPKASAKAVTNDASVAVPLEGLIDFEKERERLSTQIAKLTEEKERLDTQLSNTNFVEKAPAEKVSGLRERAAELENQISTLKNNISALQD